MSSTVVVVGAGLAAAHAVTTLREEGFDGRIVLYGDEHHVPYERPPLSKGFLMGDEELDGAFVHPRSWYDEQQVDLRLGTAVTGIDTATRTVTAGDGTTGYDRLLVATGAAPRRLALADDSGAPVAYLRTIEDSKRLKAAFAAGRRVAVVGAGWIGLETAAAARRAGADVTVLESADLPLLRVLGPEVAKVFADLHREHGVDLRLGARLDSVSGDADGAVLHLGDGSSVEADLVVVGVGAAPRTALAEQAGLAVDDGILVDEHLAASTPGVFAAGDVARAQHPTLGRRLRVEHWDNAIEQGKVVARSMLGQDVAYDRLPYFFSDQYDLGLEYVGDVGPDGYDEVVLRGDVEGRVLTALWLSGDRVLAGMQVNDWDAADTLRALVGTRRDGTKLRNRDVPLESLLD